MVQALVAPRALLLSTANTESQGNPWGIEQSFQAVQKLYDFLGVPQKVMLRYRQGEHGTAARDIESYIDFLDFAFERMTMPQFQPLYYKYSFDSWKAKSKEQIIATEYPIVNLQTDILTLPKTKKQQAKKHHNSDVLTFYKQRQDSTIQQINWLLGEEPPKVFYAGIKRFEALENSVNDDFMSSYITRPVFKKKPQIGKRIIKPYQPVGDYLFAHLYYPQTLEGKLDTSKGKLPLVIYLHQFAYPTGFGFKTEPFFIRLVEAGFAVLTLDMIGFGTRIEEGANFYERYPHWSKMGKMVADTRAAIDVAANLDIINDKAIFLTGYSLGGTVALLTAALDDRVAGTAVCAAVTPFRTNADTVEGIKLYSHLHGLLPRLGFFVGNEARIPIDFDEIMGAIAPKPLYIVANTKDFHTDIQLVTRQAMYAKKIYTTLGAETKFDFTSFSTYPPFADAQQSSMVEWLINTTKLLK
jgi:dienelactone hydrolase